ncbi:ATP-binding protein [Clostridium butyricum]|uniref:ATP-binding protein n=1 Tax=Clostridium butyricum TaxID=1492 RepID=UPI0005C30A39|nr:ATP-binding protein [Clostridium butyricum]KIU07795.1 Tn7-like transposition protein C [Clostridium butyricum]MBA8967627.1 ABC-type dipeptide/oligopeptide/nickel transport system ATPase component [Clostridium butyricum]MBA8971306.1 ABC-type dipeptide/oligopeptide/nickel transport system ATPase component [Clostridium butyricum]MBC2429369.1 ATP-binding protein [Clostridium butyricum]NOW36828.1 ABC-type dipeptide/oligopeptide/nickel transport system ATPase component [Clostridium butyricum]
MSKKVILQNGTVAIEAEYKEQILEEFNNPYIQALPDIISKSEIAKELVCRVKLKKEELSLPNEIKLNVLPRLYKVFTPLSTNVEVWNMINSLIRQGYIARNPFNAEYIRHSNKLGEGIINKTYDLDGNENFITTAQCGLIIGVSGMGKTTTVQRVISKIPQVIVHNEYENVNFNQVQVTWIKLEAPANGSIKALTLQFFSKVDALLGTNNMQRYISNKLSVDAMIPLMGQLANSIGLGLLIIDELQHLNRAEKSVMNYFVALMNTFGIPLLLIGTPACYSMLQQEMRICRRVTGSGAIIFNPIKDREFKIFMKGIWKYQLFINRTKLTKEIIEMFYDKTQGVCDLVVKLFVNVQKRALEKGYSEITLDLIEIVWKKDFVMLQPMLEAIKSNNVAKKMIYEDIKEIDNNLIIDKKEQKIRDREEVNKTGNKSVKVKKNKIKIIDLSQNDIRRIVLEGNKNNISVYDSLKKSGFIKSIEEVISK